MDRSTTKLPGPDLYCVDILKPSAANFLKIGLTKTESLIARNEVRQSY